MKLSSFNAASIDYEQSLDYYHGKDVIHTGNLLPLDPEKAWAGINSKIRNKIRNAQKLGIKIARVKGTEEDIKQFRTIWFDAEDDTLPPSLEADEIMYLAHIEGRLAGGLILSPSSKAVLYMHNLGSNDEGKRANLPALLLWNAVEDLKDSAYKYIDVGVSFRPNLYSFFKNWQVESYPIIFSPPFIRPDIRLTPFEARDIITYKQDAAKDAHKLVAEYFGDTYTILPRAIHCIKAVMQHLGVTKEDNVAVFKTFATNYLTRCVSDPIEHYTNLSDEINDHTKAVFVVHEFGFPCERTKELKAECEKRGIPLIEDCAWTCGGMLDAETKMGDVGDYAIFSLSKVFPMQYGGVLKGLTISDEDLWSKFQMLDYFKREIVLAGLQRYLPTLEAINQKRRANWRYLADMFVREGFTVIGELHDGVVPGALIVGVEDLMQEGFERYEAFGVEAGRYYPKDALYLPMHQGLDEPQLDYVYGVFRGKLNLCIGYKRNEH